MVSIARFGVAVLAIAGACAAADTALWEPGKVVSIEQVSTPAKEPDSSCRSVPKGATPPPRCRPSYLKAEQYWVVTVDAGNKRFAVRPIQTPGALYLLSQGGNEYVDPRLPAPSSIEVAVISTKALRLRAPGGREIYAMVESQNLLSAPPSPAVATTPETSPSKVVLLENSDFRELEIQEAKSQDIGEGAVLYSFTGDSSTARVNSNKPVFLVLAESDAATGGNVELSRLQVSKGTRQVPYSSAKHRSASSIPVIVTQVSATLRKLTVGEPLPPGQYVVLLENSARGFLFEVR